MKSNTEYELMYVIAIENIEALDTIKKTVKQIIEKNGGEITKESEPQKRKLAYPIKGVKNGAYLINRIEVKKEKIKEIDDKLKLEMKILRHMIIRTDELPTQEGKKIKPKEQSQKTIPEKETPDKISKEQPKAIQEEKKIAKEFSDLKDQDLTEEKSKKTRGEKKEKEKLKFEDLDKKIDDILKDDLI